MLTPVQDPDSVLPSIARALGLHEAGSRPLIESLLYVTRARRLLVVLENFEQVV